MSLSSSLYTRLELLLQENAWSFTKQQLAQLIDYVLLLEKWNRVHNLTSVRDPEQMLSKHILDSLTIANYIQGPQVLDVGSGAGLPGIPLAIWQPEHQFTLLDSNGKKTRFLLQVRQHLGLSNVQIVQSRVECFTPQTLLNTIVTREFTSFTTPKVFVERLQSFLQQEGIFLLMKGHVQQDEIAQIDKKYFSPSIHPLKIHGFDATRHLLLIKKINN